MMALILGSLSALGPLSMDMYLPSLPILADDMHTKASLAQLSITACLLGMAGGQLFIGPLSDRQGRRMPLIFSLLVYCAASLLCSFASSIWVLVLLRLVQGLAGGGGIVISRAIVRDMYSGTELTKFFSLLMLINGVAPILAPVVGGQLLKYTSWRGVFIVLCVLSLVMLAASVLGVKETLLQENRVSGGMRDTFLIFGNLLKDRMFMGYALAQGFAMGAMFAYISGSPFVVQKLFGASPQMFSIIFAINGIGIILASQITGKLAGSIKESALLGAGLAIAGLGGFVLLLMVSIHAGLIGILIPLFLVVSSVGIISTTSFSLAMQNQQKSAGSASALLGLLPFVLGSIMAPLVGIGEGKSAFPMGLIIALCELAAILFCVLLSRSTAESTLDS
ncbi:multidrug effflux MFS transporter [Heyndrickxia acidicola]|uniref:multidrug effflux MFS transporter n=1 Tax=Heyndrickxia acidicola TaxID=209389 RepID=UPI003F590CD8